MNEKWLVCLWLLVLTSRNVDRVRICEEESNSRIFQRHSRTCISKFKATKGLQPVRNQCKKWHWIVQNATSINFKHLCQIWTCKISWTKCLFLNVKQISDNIHKLKNLSFDQNSIHGIFLNAIVTYLLTKLNFIQRKSKSFSSNWNRFIYNLRT